MEGTRWLHAWPLTSRRGHCRLGEEDCTRSPLRTIVAIACCGRWQNEHEADGLPGSGWKWSAFCFPLGTTNEGRIRLLVVVHDHNGTIGVEFGKAG